jgi:hypothetical protein
MGSCARRLPHRSLQPQGNHGSSKMPRGFPFILRSFQRLGLTPMGHGDIVRSLHWTLHAVTVDRPWETSSALTKSLNAPGINKTPSFEKENCWPSGKFFGVPTAFPNVKSAVFRFGRKTGRKCRNSGSPIFLRQLFRRVYRIHRYAQGKERRRLYWHNDAWMKVWSTWIEHQGAVDSYLKSKEFERLLDELKPNQT